MEKRLLTTFPFPLTHVSDLHPPPPSPHLPPPPQRNGLKWRKSCKKLAWKITNHIENSEINHRRAKCCTTVEIPLREFPMKALLRSFLMSLYVVFLTFTITQNHFSGFLLEQMWSKKKRRWLLIKTKPYTLFYGNRDLQWTDITVLFFAVGSAMPISVILKALTCKVSRKFMEDKEGVLLVTSSFKLQIIWHWWS